MTEHDAIAIKDGGVFLTTFFENLYMPRIIYRFKRLGYEAIILRDEDNIYFDCNWRIDFPPLKDGRICMKTKMLKDKFETQLKRFREQGYEPEVSKVQQ